MYHCLERNIPIIPQQLGLLSDKRTRLHDQELPDILQSMLCNTIHLRPYFLQIKHIGSVKTKALLKFPTTTIYDSYVLLHFNSIYKCPKHSMSHSQVNNSNSTSSHNNNSSGCGGQGHSKNSSHGGHGNDTKHTPNPNSISVAKELWASSKDS